MDKDIYWCYLLSYFLVGSLFGCETLWSIQLVVSFFFLDAAVQGAYVYIDIMDSCTVTAFWIVTYYDRYGTSR